MRPIAVGLRSSLLGTAVVLFIMNLAGSGCCDSELATRRDGARNEAASALLFLGDKICKAAGEGIIIPDVRSVELADHPYQLDSDYLEGKHIASSGYAWQVNKSNDKLVTVRFTMTPRDEKLGRLVFVYEYDSTSMTKNVNHYWED